MAQDEDFLGAIEDEVNADPGRDRRDGRPGMTGGDPGPEPVLLSDGLAIMNALQGRPRGLTPRWSELAEPVVDRGEHAIFPLAVAQLPAGGDPAEAGALAEAEDRLLRDGIHFFGGDFFHSESPLDVDEGYGRSLVEAGAVVSGRPPLIWWGIEDRAAVVVRSIDRERGLETLALHVIPKDWVWSPPGASTKREASRRRSAQRKAKAADAAWSWPLPDAGDGAPGR